MTLLNIIKKSLALDIEKRFDSSNEFIKALKREIVVETYDSINGKKSGLLKRNEVKPDNNKLKGFQLIAGMDELKNILYNDVIRALNEPELYKRYGITIPNGMLLYGPPGCGKTYFAQRFAEEVGYNFILVKPSDIQSKYINATQENITKLFNEAEENSPTIIFFDELDALVPSRELELHQMLASAVNELLVQMTNCGERGIFVIAATNRPDKIDTAMLRTGRIDKIFYIPPPDKKAREEILKCT